MLTEAQVLLRKEGRVRLPGIKGDSGIEDQGHLGKDYQDVSFLTEHALSVSTI